MNIFYYFITMCERFTLIVDQNYLLKLPADRKVTEGDLS